jgi:5-methylcytosine-specific restriction endonuclease McrA
MTYVCRRCGTDFKAKHHLKQHYQRQIVCEDKHSSTSYVDLLEQEFPKKNKPFKCKYCDNSYTQQSNRSRHQMECDSKPSVGCQNDKSKEGYLLKEIKDMKIQINDIVSAMEYNLNNVKSDNNNNQSIASSSQQPKKKKTKIPQAKRIMCWNTYVGEEIGKTKCICCKTLDITTFDFQCGHIVADSVGGDTSIENLRPICAKCNNDMGAMNMRDFALQYFNNPI